MTTVLNAFFTANWLSSAADALNFDYYMRKTYLKTASLLAHSCKAAVPRRLTAIRPLFDHYFIAV